MNGDAIDRTLVAPMRIRFSDFEVSWAGQGRHADEFCFGSEDGRIKFTNLDGLETDSFRIDSIADDPINGVAFLGETEIAVSTPDEIALLSITSPRTEKCQIVQLAWGAHSVTTTSDGQFIAPLGPSGLLRVQPSAGEVQQSIVMQSLNRTLDYYEVIEVRPREEASLLVCAVRFGGIAVTELSTANGAAQVRTISTPGMDVIDVCALAPTAAPHSVAGLSRDGTLIFVSDILHDEEPTVVKFKDIIGTGYRLFCVDGTILVLTSSALYVLDNLGQRFLLGERVNQAPTHAGTLEIEAVDANLCWNRWLLITLDDEVLRFDVKALLTDRSDRKPPQNNRTFEPIDMPTATKWQSNLVSQVVAAA